MERRGGSGFGWIGLSGVEQRQQYAQQSQGGCRGGHVLGAAIVRLTAGWRADGYDRLEEIDTRLGITKTIRCLAHIVAILALLDRDDAQRRIGVLIGGGKVRDGIMLIVGQLYVILGPNDSWRRVRLNVALQIHVVLQRLTQAWSRHRYNRRKFHLDIDVATISLADAVVGHTVVGAAILLLHRLDAQYVAHISGAIWKGREKREIVISKGCSSASGYQWS